MHIAVITSMKTGLNLFVYRELEVLEAQGVSISLFPTKYRRGLYNPKKDWHLHRWNPLVAVLSQILYILNSPVKYIKLFVEALKEGAVIDYVLACYFANQMKEIDVIYSIFGDHKLFIGYFCKKILHKPLVVTIHAYELYQNPNPHLFVHALGLCDHIITVTDFNKKLLVDRYQIDPSRIEVVRVSVDTEDYRPVNKFVILIASYFDERKGHELLFKAVRELDQDDIEIWVVGGRIGRADEVDVPGLATKYNLESQIAFFDKLSGTALKAVYRSCDVFCLPIRESSSGISDGFPTVLMEAMAFGKPVITTRHVEIPNVVPEILVDVNDVHGLAEAIKKLYQSKTLRRKLGSRNRKIAEELFTTRNAERTAQILSDLSSITK